LNSHQVTKDLILPLSDRNGRGVFAQENDVCPQSPVPKES